MTLITYNNQLNSNIMKSLKSFITLIILMAFMVTAQAQQIQMQVSGAVSQHQTYSELGISLGESNTSSFFLTFANSQTSRIPSYTGIGYSFTKEIYDKANIISGFDVSGIVRDGLEFGSNLNLNVGINLYKFDLLYSIPAFHSFENNTSFFSPEALLEPQLKVRFRW